MHARDPGDRLGMTDTDELTTRRQALVTMDALEEALHAREYEVAAERVERLCQRIEELQGDE